MIGGARLVPAASHATAAPDRASPQAEVLADAELHNHLHHAPGSEHFTLRDRIRAHKLAERSQTPAAAVSVGTGWRAQFGAFADAASAEQLQARIATARGLMPDRPAIVPGDGLHRVVSETLASRNEAEAICRTARPLGIDCFVGATR